MTTNTPKGANPEARPRASITPIVQWLRLEAALWSPDSSAPIEAKRLAEAADEIERLRADKDGAYHERNMLVALLARIYPSGIKRTEIEGWDPEWHGCVYIELPTGQASWHYHDSEAHLFVDLPSYEGEWDGHTAEEKYACTRVLIGNADAARLGDQP